MSRLTLELLRDPELQRLSQQAHGEEMAEARSERRPYDREKMLARMRVLLDWRARALRAESQLRREK